MSDQHWQWTLSRIQAPRAWRFTTGDPTVVVAVLDTGVDYGHPELAGKVLRGVNLMEPIRAPHDDNGHGTAVSCIAAGVGAGLRRRFRGVAPHCRILPIKVNYPHSGHVRAQQITEGIWRALDEGADVINMSVGCNVGEPGFTHEWMARLAAAVREALGRGVPVVCAGGPREVHTYPAAWSTLPEYKGLIAVGSTDRRDRPHRWSPRWPYVTLVAPADGVTGYPTYHPRAYGRFGGTSASSPHVAGVVALMRTLRPDLTPAQIQAVLLETADPVGGGRFRRVNAYQALRAIAPRSGKKRYTRSVRKADRNKKFRPNALECIDKLKDPS